MPIYEYQCDSCSYQFEVKQSMKDAPLTTCERCGESLHRLISSPGIMFKGSGWYVTDYSNKLKPPSEGEESARPEKKKQAATLRRFGDGSSGRQQLNTGQHLLDQFTGLNAPTTNTPKKLAHQGRSCYARPTSWRLLLDRRFQAVLTAGFGVTLAMGALAATGLDDLANRSLQCTDTALQTGNQSALVSIRTAEVVDLHLQIVLRLRERCHLILQLGLLHGLSGVQTEAAQSASGVPAASNRNQPAAPPLSSPTLLLAVDTCHAWHRSLLYMGTAACCIPHLRTLSENPRC